MKLCTFSLADAPRPGLVLGPGTGTDARVLDLHSPDAVAALGFAPACLEDVVASHLDAVRALTAKDWTHSATLPLASLRLKAPFITRAKVLGVAKNFSCAVKSMQCDPPESPLWFAKLPNTLIGSNESIGLIDACANVTYEAEVGLVVGKKTRDVSVADAPKHIGGYTIVNDLTAMDLLKSDGGDFFRAKNVDGFCPMGPFFVTADEIADPHNLRITLDMDGKRLQDGNTANILFTMFELVSRISQIMTLEPGDVIATGTPAGAAASHTPQAWLCPGQELRVAVEGLGELVNRIQ